MKSLGVGMPLMILVHGLIYVYDFIERIIHSHQIRWWLSYLHHSKHALTECGGHVGLVHVTWNVRTFVHPLKRNRHFFSSLLSHLTSHISHLTANTDIIRKMSTSEIDQKPKWWCRFWCRHISYMFAVSCCLLSTVSLLSVMSLWRMTYESLCGML